MKVGFIINPIAGMGGRVGLKGTDNVLEEAIRRGAKPVAEERAIEFLKNVKINKFYTCSGPMGENAFSKLNDMGIKKIKTEIVYNLKNDVTTAEDTKKSAELMAKIVDIIVFVGGDGTACDIYDAIDAKLPILGVPAGVKMYSAVFAYTPRDAGNFKRI